MSRLSNNFSDGKPQPDNHEGVEAGKLRKVSDPVGLTIEGLQEWHDEACLAVLNNKVSHCCSSNRFLSKCISEILWRSVRLYNRHNFGNMQWGCLLNYKSMVTGLLGMMWLAISGPRLSVRTQMHCWPELSGKTKELLFPNQSLSRINIIQHLVINYILNL